MQLNLWGFAPADTRHGDGMTPGVSHLFPSDSSHRIGEIDRMAVITGKRGLSPIYLDQALADQQPEIKGRKAPKKRIAFGWYGGKFSHLEWLLPLLPTAHHFCEPFAGSAAVLLNRAPAPVETYNDIDGEVVNFFRVLRDDTELLARQIGLTPFSREEFYHAVTDAGRKLTDLERARRFFVRARQARTGLAQTATLGRWANCKKHQPFRNVRRDFAMARRD